MKCLKELKSSFCGCSLRTGTIIIGYLGVFFYTVFSIFMVIFVVLYATGKLEEEHYKPIKHEKEMMYTVLGVFSTFGIGLDIGNILLLFGVYKEKLPCVNVYIWITTIWFIVLLVITLRALIGFFYIVLIFLVWLVLELYCLLIVNSYYCAMKREELIATIAQSRL